MARAAKARRERKKVSAKRRLQEHEIGGGSNYLQLIEGLGRFKPKAGAYRLDFMSYKVGKGNPFANEGDEYYERTFWVHRDVGPNKEWHLCAAKTFKHLNKSCPICEERGRMSQDPDSDENVLKAMAPKERQLFLIRDREEPEELLLWEVSFHLFGNVLDKKLKASDEEDGYDFFADPEDGFTLRVVMDQSQHGKWLETTDIEFRNRKQQYDLSEVDDMPCLDDMLVATPYEQLKRKFFMIEEDTEDDDEKDDDEKEEKKTKRTRKTSPKKKEEQKPATAEEEGIEKGCEVEHNEFGLCVVTRISGDGTSLTIKDEDGELHRAIGADEVRLIEDDEPEDDEPEDDEPEEKPKKMSRKTSKKKTPVDDDDDDDDWDD